MYDAILAETVSITGHHGDAIEAYLARPLSPGPHGGVVVIHHMPGYDSATKEMVRTFAVNGYNAICPNLYWRIAPGASPDDAAAAARAAGGVSDEQVVGDVAGAVRHLNSLTSANGKTGVIGHCSGGRHAFLVACGLTIDAAVDCYGAFVVKAPGPEMPVPPTMKPLMPIAGNLSCPLLGLFGNEDRFPEPDEVTELERELSRLGKSTEFHRYDNAGHAFFAVDRPSYRPEAAVDGWRRILDFYGRHLAA
ncbi:MAG: dienelactone hydrolase family protein [Kutzneria sp.]|nr:dienelactone hydrolase family protein [Kutzneria sp.]